MNKKEQNLSEKDRKKFSLSEFREYMCKKRKKFTKEFFFFCKQYDGKGANCLLKLSSIEC